MNKPTDINLSLSSFDEDIESGSLISTLSTVDLDSGDSHTYEFVSGEGDDDNDSFTIDGNTLNINTSPDYETQSSYNIRLKTTDSSDLSYEETITLSLNTFSKVKSLLSVVLIRIE